MVSSVNSGNMPALPKVQPVQILWFLVWPFGALIGALRNFRKPWSKTIFWLFCIFVGLAFIIAADVVGSADNARYAANLVYMHSHLLSFDYFLSLFYNPNEGFVDVYQPLVTWMVAVFTDNPNVLFAVFAAVFGYFYTQNLWIVFKRINVKVGVSLFLFMLAFALVNPIWNINGVRMWTAAQIFAYGNLLYFLENKKSGLAWSVASILVHFSFLFPVSILLAFIFLPKRILPFFIFYIVASFINEINLIAVRQILSFLPDVFQPRVEGYTNEAYTLNMAETHQQLNWQVRFSVFAGRTVVYAWIIILFLNQKLWAKHLPRVSCLFAFALFIGGWAQIASLVPSGGRFLIVANMLFYASFILVIVNLYRLKTILQYALFTTPLLLFTTIFALRIGAGFMGFTTFIGNPILAFIIEDQTPLIDFIKGLL